MKEDQLCQANTGHQPAGGAGVEQERIHVTERRSLSLNSLSNEGLSSQPSDSGQLEEKKCNSMSNIWDDDDDVAVQENTLREMVFTLKNHGCLKKDVWFGLCYVSV